MPIGHAGPEIAMIVGAIATLLFATFASQRFQSWSAAVAGLTLIVAAAEIARIIDLEQQVTFSGVWALDDTAAWSKMIIIISSGLVVLMSPDWFHTDQRHGEYYAVLLFGGAGAMAMASAADLSELVLAVLLSSITGYVMAAYHRASPVSVEAGMKYFLIGLFGNTALLLGATFMFGIAGTTRYAGFAPGSVAGAAGVIAVVSLVIGLAFKVGAAPVHEWVPDVAQGAPVPSAAFLTVVPKVAALVAFARLIPAVSDEIAWRPIVAVISVATMTIGNLGALRQEDVRRLLGWSSVSQAGYGLMAVVVVDRTDFAIPALLMFVAAYALANIAAFAVVAELRGLTALDHYQGLGTKQPLLAGVLAISLLSLVGIPPLGGFTAKLELFTAAIDGGYGWLALVAVANTVLSLAYYLRVLEKMYLQPVENDVPARLGWRVTVAAMTAVILVVALGLFAGPVLEAFESAQLLGS